MTQRETSAMSRLIRFAFDQLYTHLAWGYDRVADAVSFGEWKAWGRAAIPFLTREGRLLEIAHGPGHLYLTLRQQGFEVIGLDLSPQMARRLRQRVLQTTGRPAAQVRASALRLPFASGSFACVVSTFPAAFIFAPETLREVRRVLRPGGRFVVVPTARLTGQDALTALVKLAYRVTGQGQSSADRARQRFESAGYTFAQHVVQTARAEVVVWVCAAPHHTDAARNSSGA
ncbi:MAG: methyltransferase domain-containing protein [Chloroflexi bacterium]|jgi:ubiquinone/menaquinone biosynthesis C-methylase UbiE|uniref:Class I SAM-dependent methyltransferase n=1 Tax=Candidatus Thermofonsia Clade 3 bacterium TaxID=2364212 RepID=A0A2M8QAL4_9CHLR|nr:methyltransferase domain-containing protein [Candidatus Roseilinea sp. NK_OTU-006]PJF46846.1 MAG: class I SAM-dependent methyltransferase [Candidatus Thermofonsia Clade 3 bacterium]RMG65914.1 MAG: methyltransferase domain-containing protein [Chloroflexota bacterium]